MEHKAAQEAASGLSTQYISLALEESKCTSHAGPRSVFSAVSMQLCQCQLSEGEQRHARGKDSLWTQITKRLTGTEGFGEPGASALRCGMDAA